jgi:hypothetical protein
MRRALTQSTRSLQPCSFRAGARRPLPRTHNFAASSLQKPREASWTTATSRAFSSSSRVWAEETGSSDDKKQKSKSSSSNEDRGQAGKSPFSVFVDVLREELQKSREMNENIKVLQGETSKAMDSEAMKKMKAAYEKARVRCFSTFLARDHAADKPFSFS